jgi:hypothetical protein
MVIEEVHDPEAKFNVRSTICHNHFTANNSHSYIIVHSNLLVDILNLCSIRALLEAAGGESNA